MSVIQGILISTKNLKEGVKTRMTLVGNPAFTVRAKYSTSTGEETD
jgi:hypothetical protein